LLFDKYQKISGFLNQKNKKNGIDEMIESGDDRNFEMKWMDKLVDIDKDLDGDYDDD